MHPRDRAPWVAPPPPFIPAAPDPLAGASVASAGEDGVTLVVKCGFDDRDFRMAADPATFFTTDHYRGYPTVLINLATVTRADLHDVLEQAWRINAPKRLLAQYQPDPQ